MEDARGMVDMGCSVPGVDLAVPDGGQGPWPPGEGHGSEA